VFKVGIQNPDAKSQRREGPQRTRSKLFAHLCDSASLRQINHSVDMRIQSFSTVFHVLTLVGISGQSPREKLAGCQA
jgi:hypothetical protein